MEHITPPELIQRRLRRFFPARVEGPNTGEGGKAIVKLSRVSLEAVSEGKEDARDGRDGDEDGH